MDDPVMVTDNRMTAECVYPDRRIVPGIASVPELKNGTQAAPCSVRIGAVPASPDGIRRHWKEFTSGDGTTTGRGCGE